MGFITVTWEDWSKYKKLCLFQMFWQTNLSFYQSNWKVIIKSYTSVTFE